MHSVIDMLYRGELQPCECVYPDDSYAAIHRRATVELRDSLEKRLNADTAEHLERLVDTFEKLIHAESNEAFRRGFTLGAGLVMEVCNRLPDPDAA